jgi:protein-L-isoaspartate(D-aspartate) O-methyltransferase
LGAVRFVPLIGEAGWQPEQEISRPAIPSRIARARPSLPDLIRVVAEPFNSVESANLQPLLERIGNARLVLIGEASHGTSEFYRIRAEITKALVERKGLISSPSRRTGPMRTGFMILSRTRSARNLTIGKHSPDFRPGCNQEVLDFIHWLRDFNLQRRTPTTRVGFYGLDLYSLFTSIHCVLKYLDRVDPEAAAVARVRYGCLTPWEADPATYGRAALTGRYRSCEVDAVRMLQDLSRRRVEAAVKDGEDLFDAQLNARLIADAEEYYRSCTTGRTSPGITAIRTCSRPCGCCSTVTGLGARRLLGAQFSLGLMRLLLSLENTARSTSASFAGRHSATLYTRSDRDRPRNVQRRHGLGRSDGN